MNQNALNGGSPRWTFAQSAKACAMWARGLPAAEIAHAVGKTKNAVIGHAHRKGWGVHQFAQEPRGAK